MKTLIVLAALSATLGACSNSPSDSDVESAVIGGLGIANCRHFSINDFEKVNGITSSDGKRHRADVKYALKVAPLPNAKAVQDELATRHASEDLQLQKAQQKYGEFEAVAKDQPPGNRDTVLNIQLNNEVDKAKFAIRERAMHDAVALLKRYSDGCTTESGFMFGYLTKLYADDKNWLTTGITRKISDTVELVKTDNGWVQLR